MCRYLGVAFPVIALVLGISRASDIRLEPIYVGAPVRIEVHPADFELVGTREQLRLIVTGHYANGQVQDLTRTAQFVADNSSVDVNDDGVVHPKRNGEATITVQVGGQEATTNIRVTGQSKSQQVSFQYETLAALSKQGCNAGACHGSPSGKGGFRLSLRAFDAQLDELTLIREEQGRRTNPIDPESSLLLLKPLMKVSHGGGKRLSTHDPAYRILCDWIKEGCRTDAEDAPRCVGIEVLPSGGRVLERPAHTQQICVLARFSDGHQRDVTHLAVFSSSDTEVASVTPEGLVVGHDRGEVAVIVRYLEFIESSFLTFVKDIEGYEWNNPPVNNYIDTHVHAKLRQLQYLPSERCTDEEFLRRVYLDILGILPTVEEVEQFLSSNSNDKRSHLIDELLERPEYAKFWALKWGDMLRMTSGQVGASGVHKYHRWVERAIQSNLSYDEFAYQLLTASGSTLDNPPANFYQTARDMNDCVETISQVFLGARLQCAKCHNHPFERWTQDNYFGMAAFFNRLQRTKTRRPNELFVWSSTLGEVTQPRTGNQMQPWVPIVGVMENANPVDRRTTFADWLSRPDNPFFAKVEVNRIWSHLLGRGIVDPPDDFRDSNPPSNAVLLRALSEDFVRHGYDRKHIIRTILNSQTYQASIHVNDFNREDTKYFSHYQPRLLTAEQLLDAICHVTGVPETFESLPAGTKATQLPAPDLVKHDFLKVFGQPERQTVCQCERTTESNLGMAIQFLNGPLIHDKLCSENNRFRTMIDEGKSDEEIIATLHLAAISRPPTESELRASLDHVDAKRKQLDIENSKIEEQIERVTSAISEISLNVREDLLSAKLMQLPEAIRADAKVALETPEEERCAVQAYLVDKLGPLLRVSDEDVTASLSEKMKTKNSDLRAKLAKLASDKKTPAEVRLLALEDVCWVLLNRNEFLFNH